MRGLVIGFPVQLEIVGGERTCDTGENRDKGPTPARDTWVKIEIKDWLTQTAIEVSIFERLISRRSGAFARATLTKIASVDKTVGQYVLMNSADVYESLRKIEQTQALGLELFQETGRC